MALDKQTKSVLFSEGMGDGTDRFLLEAPAIDYAENLRVDKQGSLQKRPGFGPDALTTVPNATGEPFFAHGAGDNLTVLTEAGVRSYNGTSWSQTDLGGFLGTQGIVAESPPAGGMGHIDILPYYVGSVLTNYLIAYEVRETSTSNNTLGSWESTPKHVVTQSYTSDGKFLGQGRIEGSRSPKLFIHPDASIGFPMVVYQKTSDLQLHIGFVNPLDGKVIGAGPIATGVTVSPTFGMECHASLIEYGGFATPMWFTRLGASSDGHARYHIAVDTDNERLLILYQEDGDVKLALMAANLGSAETTIDVALVSLTPTHRYEAFDLIYDSGAVYYMYGGYAPTDPRESIVKVSKRDAAGAMTFRWSHDVTDQGGQQPSGPGYYPRTYTHGSLAKKPGENTVAWAVHDSGQAVGYDPEETSPVQPGVNLESVRDHDTGLHYGLLTDNGGTGTPDGSPRMLPHHRLATSLVWFEDDLYAGVQQWHDCTPYTDDMAANVDAVDGPSVLGAAVPRTTVFAVFDPANNIVRPVSSIDPGNSKTSEYTESEFQTHLPNVYLDADDILIPNRVVIQAEDMSMRWSIQGVPPNQMRTASAEHPADALCRIYRVTKGASEGMGSSVFGDGVFVSAAVPMWFDGKFFGEIGPLDQPEIIDVRDARMEDLTSSQVPPRCRINFDGVDLNSTGNTAGWRKFQVITGYYDAKGNKHRSAPSSTVYVDSVSVWSNDKKAAAPTSFAEDWRGRAVTVYFTLPLSVLPESLEYFVEAYVSDTLDDDPVLVDTSTIDVSETISPDAASITLALVRATSPIEANEFKLPDRTANSVYTSGGTLAADPWPAFTHSVVTSTRLWAIDSVNSGRVIPSKLFEDNISPEYNSTLTVRLGDERNLTAIGKLDDKTIIFEPNDIHVIYGEGPDNRGQGQDFAVHYISTDVGCTDQESIVETPIGLIFYSKPRGFYLLDRNLQIQFIGEGIEDTSYDIDIISAQLVKDKAEVRFAYTGGPGVRNRFGPTPDTTAVERPPYPVFTNGIDERDYPALTFNYERKTWMTYTNYDAQAATIYQNRYTMLRSDWSIWQEKDDRWDDPTGLNMTKLVTPWIKLSENIQGFNRLWRMTILGRYLSSLQDMGWDSGRPYVFDEKVGTGGGFGAGEVRFNAVDLIDATICRVQDIDNDGGDNTALWSALTGANVSVLSDAGDGCVFLCSGTTDAGAFHELDIAAGSIVIFGNPLNNLDDVTVTAQIPTYEGADIMVRVYFDYEAFHQQEKTFKLQDFVSNPFNLATDEHHDRAERLQFEISPQRGRCQAVKLQIFEVPTEAIAEGIIYKQGRGFEIVALDLHVGVSPMRALLPKAVK